MEHLTEREIRGSFVNGTRGDAQRMHLPDLTEQRWPGLDFLGWVDPKAPQQSHLVLRDDDGAPLGVHLRRNTSAAGLTRARMCSLCCTTHPGSGVALMVAPRAGRAGRDGNTVGIEVCTDLRCSGYLRGWAPAPTVSLVHETLSTEEQVARLRRNLQDFVDRVRR
ncbi:FBP domain-containing protein [Nocardioides sp. R-C-SC26]|uniref:FBP domain-containing protein n=1 Tax=Nocardioides sp. R-C-SC26 TaxID=2870414 RepID=UPI001E5A5AD2|nr:FBP domain-containing protein [Nocardioides sp. R-C-SC26]